MNSREICKEKRNKNLYAFCISKLVWNFWTILTGHNVISIKKLLEGLYVKHKPFAEKFLYAKFRYGHEFL